MTGFQSKRASARDKLTGTTLIDRVLEQIEQDVKNKDFTAIEELLQMIPEKNLISFLSEETL
jgi:dihydroneopterin aldolase